MRVYLESLGCRLNYAEMALLGRQLVGAGHEMVTSAAEADVCVLNSCAVTGEAARKSRQMARHLARANPDARLVVTGCYATLEAEAVAALPNVTLVVGNPRKDELLGLIEARAAAGDVPGSADPASFAVSPAAAGQANRAGSAVTADGDGDRRAAAANDRKAIALSLPTERTRAFVKVQDGCHNRCTFCIVTIARGEERSRPVADIVHEINALHAAGFQEAVLTGV
ncbi:MAG TPA: radical SAM protein, partial [Anaerolineae bacterium]